MAFVDPVTREVTLQKIDLTAVEQIEGTLPILGRRNGEVTGVALINPRLWVSL